MKDNCILFILIYDNFRSDLSSTHSRAPLNVEMDYQHFDLLIWRVYSVCGELRLVKHLSGNRTTNTIASNIDSHQKQLCLMELYELA